MPTVVDVDTQLTTRGNVISTTHELILATNVGANDWNVVDVTIDADPSGVTWPAGWDQVAGGQIGTTRFVETRRKLGPQSNPTITLGVASSCCAVAKRVTGADTGSGVWDVAGPGNSAGTSPNPPALTPAGGSKAYLWHVLMGHDHGGRDVTTYPTNYLSQVGSSNGSTGTGCGCWSCDRELTAATEDPGAWLLNGNCNSSTFIVAIPPSVGGPPDTTISAPSIPINLTPQVPTQVKEKTLQPATIPIDMFTPMPTLQKERTLQPATIPINLFPQIPALAKEVTIDPASIPVIITVVDPGVIVEGGGPQEIVIPVESIPITLIPIIPGLTAEKQLVPGSIPIQMQPVLPLLTTERTMQVETIPVILLPPLAPDMQGEVELSPSSIVIFLETNDPSLISEIEITPESIPIVVGLQNPAIVGGVPPLKTTMVIGRFKGTRNKGLIKGGYRGRLKH